jgi:UDP-N-acetyl-D-mannosaminuronic acid dehydrogenase
MHTSKRVIVIGTGYVGLPAALMWAKSGLDVVGVDIDENLVRAINDRTLLLKEDELRTLLADSTVRDHLRATTAPCEGDYFVIAVPTPVDALKKVCDMGAVQSALESIVPHIKPGNVVIVESTVPPLTCQKVVKPLLEKLTGLRVPEDIKLAHCPERILPGDIFREIVENDRLIGGMDAASTHAAAELYGTFVKGKLHLTDDVTAELSKLMENTYRDVNIALANEFAQICELVGADPKTVIGFANKHPRVNILSPGIGVGGHCIPVDPWFLKEIAPYNSRLISMARIVNDEMPLKVAEKIRKLTADFKDPIVLLLGATYKKNCEDARESPAGHIADLLRADGYKVRQYDPHIPELCNTRLAEAVTGADLIAVLVPHDDMMRELQDCRAAFGATMRHTRIVNFAE